MYVKTDCLLSSLSASAVSNNLAVRMSKSKKTVDQICIIHKDSACVVQTRESETSKSKCIRAEDFFMENVKVTQAALFKLGYEIVLAVTSTMGLHLYDHSKNECIFCHPCVDTKNSGARNYAKGIGVFETDSLFCVGNNTGSIRLFGLGEFYSEISFIDRKNYHNYPIIDLTTYKNYLASADENGLVIIWQLDKEELLNIANFNINSNCTAIRFKKDLLIAAFGSGHIRMYDVGNALSGQNTGTVNLTAEVSAHARYITGLDIADGGDLVLTVSEDSFAKIWSVKKEGGHYVINHKSNVPIKDSLLMGGRFLNSSGTSFCVSAYDNNIITCYTQQ